MHLETRKEGGIELSPSKVWLLRVDALTFNVAKASTTGNMIFSLFCYLGEFQLPLNSVDLAGPIEEWRDLAPVDDGSNQYLGDLCLSLRYVPSSGKLTVAVLEARKLKKMDITGASDPYVKLKLFDSKVPNLTYLKK